MQIFTYTFNEHTARYTFVKDMGYPLRILDIFMKYLEVNEVLLSSVTKQTFIFVPVRALKSNRDESTISRHDPTWKLSTQPVKLHTNVREYMWLIPLTCTPLTWGEHNRRSFGYTCDQPEVYPSIVIKGHVRGILYNGKRRTIQRLWTCVAYKLIVY